MTGITRPTSEQIVFKSAKTGEHVLDAYMENAERGTKTLADLLDQFFDPATGDLYQNFIELRVSTNDQLQYRIGQDNPWVNMQDTILAFRGTWQPSTSYQRTNIVVNGQIAYYCTESHISGGSFDPTKFQEAFSAENFVANWVWKSNWQTATPYLANNIVRESGNTYICLEDHTSGTFSTDLSTNKWEVLVLQGAAGPGSGDLLASNNLSDVANVATARSNLGLTIGTHVQAFDAATAKTNQAQTYTAAQRGSVVTPSFSSNITLNFNTANNFSFEATSNFTLENPTNLTAGQSGTIAIKQDGTGSRLITFGSKFKFSGGVPVTLTTVANRLDLITYYVHDADNIIVSIIKDAR